MASIYRVLITVFFYLVAVSTAPQDSALTYIEPSEVRPSQPSVPLTTSNEETPTEAAIQTGETATDQSVNNPRFSRDNEYTASIETSTASDITERVVNEVLATEPNDVKPKFPAPRFISKLSYFKKTEDTEGSALRNFLERTGKRKFRSRCRCEKIWNCPKLQITVPRCPDEYFLCCF